MFLWRSISEWLILRMMLQMTCHPAFFFTDMQTKWNCRNDKFFIFFFTIMQNSVSWPAWNMWLVNLFNYFSIGQCDMVVILGSAWKHITAFLRNRNQHKNNCHTACDYLFLPVEFSMKAFSCSFCWTIADSFVARKNMLVVFFFLLKIDIFIAMCNNISDCLMEEDTWKESKALLVVFLSQ